MSNGEIRKINNIKKSYPEVILIKMIILLVILFIPLAFMITDVARSYSRYKLSLVQKGQGGPNNSQEGPDFIAPIPSGYSGNIANVPKEKIDTLFDNLKQ
jgi:hypothetical protein